MHDAFLRSLLDSPRDDASRLVYADWLEDQDDPPAARQADYLRLTVQLAVPALKKGLRKALRKRLQALAADLDTDWLAVVSRIPVENCATKRAAATATVEFRFVCDRDWSDMVPTEDETVRHCAHCREDVHYCGTIKEARDHARQGHCIAVDLGVIRRDHDLEPPQQMLMLGRPAPSYFERAAERLELDAVSAARERRKQESQDGG